MGKDIEISKLPRSKKGFLERNRGRIYREHRKFINQFVKDWVEHHGQDEPNKAL